MKVYIVDHLLVGSVDHPLVGSVDHPLVESVDHPLVESVDHLCWWTTLITCEWVVRCGGGNKKRKKPQNERSDYLTWQIWIWGRVGASPPLQTQTQINRIK